MARKIPENSTPIINPILEALARAKLSTYEFNIVMAVIRKTYGWDKKNDWITGSQLSNLTGILQNHCYRTIAKLVKKNILTKDNLRIGLNKRVSEWLLPKQVVPKQVVPKQVVGSTHIGSQVIPIQVYTKDTITKDTITKETHKKILDMFNSYTGKNFQLTSQKKKQLQAILKMYSVSQIEQAIKNRLNDPSSMGKNKDKKIWAYDWDSLFRKVDYLDKALNLEGSVAKDDDFYIQELNELGMNKFINKYDSKTFAKYSDYYNPIK